MTDQQSEQIHKLLEEYKRSSSGRTRLKLSSQVLELVENGTQRQQADVRAQGSRNQAIRAKVLAEVWGEVKRRIKEHRPKEERGE